MSADGQRQDRRWIVQHAGKWTVKASKRWIMQHAGRCIEAGQEMDHAACRQIYRGFIDGQERQGRRWIIQHVGKWTEAGQEMDHIACLQMYRGRTGDG
jgi:hypothetical protein